MTSIPMRWNFVKCVSNSGGLVQLNLVQLNLPNIITKEDTKKLVFFFIIHISSIPPMPYTGTIIIKETNKHYNCIIFMFLF